MYESTMLKMSRRQARKFKKMGESIQRRVAVDFALYYRRVIRAQHATSA